MKTKFDHIIKLIKCIENVHQIVDNFTYHDERDAWLSTIQQQLARV
jgi:hypothetical protein